MPCKYCGVELPADSGPRKEFCDNAHKQKYYRRQHQQDQDAALAADVEQLRAQVQDQAQTIEELEREISRLRERLDIERRYLEDKKPRYFKSWLRKQPTSPLSEILLGDQLIPNRGARSLYQAHVKRLVPDEMEDFVRLWKLMLLTEP